MKAVLAKRRAVLVLGTAVWALIAFGAAGTVAWMGGWVLLALNLATFAVSTPLMLRYNPDLIEARSSRHEGVKPFDQVIVGIYKLMIFIVPLVAGLDAARFGWLPLPSGAMWAGIAIFALGAIPVLWALVSNPWLEMKVRIQEDRGHRVANGGPYRLVRHPMYVGIIVQYLGMPLILGSAWAYAPAAAVVLLFVVRTALEDRTLRAELPGYEEYARQTTSRLIPAVW
jgi:protein-S-isoprenylcysteine O-methyltransferase Ste14